MLDDAWQGINADLEMIQTEGFGAVRQVDPNMVMKKKKGADVEVQEGWLGHVLPFELVQRELLADELAEVDAMDKRLAAIGPEVSELFDSLSEDDKQDAGEAVNEDGDAYVAAQLKAAAKQLRRDLGPQANDPESLPCRLEAAARLFDEEKDMKKRAKEAREALDTKTKATIEGLTDEQALAMLNAKWVKPLVAEFHMLPDAVIDGLVEKVQALRDKYSETYADIDAQIQQAESELVGMLGQLTGNEYDMAGINELAKLLGGELR